MLFSVVPPPTLKPSVMQIQHKSCSSAYPHQSSRFFSQVLLPLLPAQTYSLQIENVQRTTVAAIHPWALISLERSWITYSYLLCFGFLFVCVWCFFFFFPNITWRKKSCHEKIYLPYLQFLLEKKYSLHCWQLVIFLICEQLTSLILCLEYKLSSTDHQIILYSSHWHYSQSKNNKKEGNYFFFGGQKCFGLLGRLAGTWNISWKHRTSPMDS